MQQIPIVHSLVLPDRGSNTPFPALEASMIAIYATDAVHHTCVHIQGENKLNNIKN